MTVAELRGKISSTGTNLNERMEDLLTSDVFGTFGYLPTHLGLLDFLGTSHTRHGEYFAPAVDPVRVDWSFWPYLKSRGITPCEPDVVPKPKVGCSGIAGADWLREGVEYLRCIALMPQIADVICVKDDIASLET